jgi:hypothetical protein
MADLAYWLTIPSFTNTIKKTSGGFVAILCVVVSSVFDDKPMLWETTTQTVSDKLIDPSYANKWFSKVGPPETRRLCLKPYQPRLGKVQRKDVDCRYTRISSRQAKVFRRRICNGDPPSSFITIITGKETADAYDLLQATTVRNDRGKKLWISKLRETGQRIGECPAGMRVEQ